jgi:integrase/recombinase XerD
MSNQSSNSIDEPEQNPYVADYLTTNEALVLAPSTVRTYRSRLREYIRYLSAIETTVLNAEREDVVAFIEECVRRRNRESTLSGKLNTIYQLYKHIELNMNEGDELQLDPLELETINLERYRTPAPIEREALTREELRQLFDTMDSYRNRLLAITAAETGLRNSDLRELTLDDVYFDKLEIHASDPKNSIPYEVPMSDDLAFELECWIDGPRIAHTTATESSYLFPGKYSAKLETNGGLNTIIKTAAERAGIQRVIGTSEIDSKQLTALETERSERSWHRVTPHTLRHTFITLLKDAGIQLSYRQLVANHANPETTRGYTHGKDDVFETIRDRFDPPR